CAGAAASGTPGFALAPRRDLLGVPSSSIIASSSARWSEASIPVTASAISPRALATARATPFPCQRGPPSRSSTASKRPVEAPEGTAARPRAPERSPTSTSTVGLPRLSSTWRASTRAISLTRATSCRPPRAGEGDLALPRRGYFLVVVAGGVVLGAVVLGVIGALVGVVLGALYCLQSITTNPERQSVFEVHLALNFFTKFVSDDCCCVAVSCALIVACACLSDCWLPAVVFLTRKT